MGDYQWITYEEVKNQSLEVGSGLLHLRHKVGEKIVLFAETRQEWTITAMACIRYKFPGEADCIFAIGDIQTCPSKILLNPLTIWILIASPCYLKNLHRYIT